MTSMIEDKRKARGQTLIGAHARHELRMYVPYKSGYTMYHLASNHLIVMADKMAGKKIRYAFSQAHM